MQSHEAQRELAYTPEQLFDLAADVARYPEFLRWCVAARVNRRDGNVYYCDQIVGFGVFRERFGSKTVLQPPERIVVTSTDRMFRHFELIWLFDPMPGTGCRVTLRTNLELQSKIAQSLFRRVIADTVGSIMLAFEARAHQLYDPPMPLHSAAKNAPSSGPDTDHGASVAAPE